MHYDTLTRVTIPSGVTVLEDGPFFGCTNLLTITVALGNPVYSSVGGVLFNKALTTLVGFPGGKSGFYTIPSSVTSIERYAFAVCNLTGVTIPSTVTTIGHGAFDHCPQLASITIPAGVTAIEDRTFSGCISLHTILFMGNAPTLSSDSVAFLFVFGTVYRLAGASGWGETFGDCPVKIWNDSDTPATITVSFSALGGSVANPASQTVTAGSPYGALPATTRAGYTFAGWWTSASGAGTRVTAETTVASAVNHTLYARWTALPLPPGETDSYFCDPLGDAALETVGSYDGFFYTAEDFAGEAATAVKGTLTLKVSSTAGKLTAKALLLDGNVSFSVKVWDGVADDGTCHAMLTTRSGETLDLFVRQNRIWGTLVGGKAGTVPLTLDGGRNRFADRGDAEATVLLDGFKGYYTMTLPTYAGISRGDVEAAPAGVGYLAITVGAKGSAKVAGVLADGTKVSRSGRLILFANCGEEACVPLFAPLYSKKGWAGGLLWLDPATQTVVTDGDAGWFVRWEKPGKGPDGFGMLLDVCGGFYNNVPTLAAGYLFSAEASEAAYHHAGGIVWSLAMPGGVSVAATGARMTVAKSLKPKKITMDGVVEYVYDEANPANTTLAFTARTGIFKGAFTLWYEYDVNGKSALKGIKAPYTGILTPVRAAAFDVLPAGMGHCLVPDNDPVLKAYKLKRSYPVWLDE